MSGPGVSGLTLRRSAAPRRLAGALAAAMCLAVVAGCGAAAGAHASNVAGPSEVAGPSNVAGPSYLPVTTSNTVSAHASPSPLTAIKATVAKINATAGGQIDAQRAVLDRVAAPDQHQQQLDCPTATTTLSFDPAYRDLRPAPDGDDHEFLLPAYINIYTGKRITSSDMTTLRLWMIDGRARTMALCVA